MQRETSDGMGIFDQIQPSDPRFSTKLLSEVHAFGRNFCAETDERWSLVDCGLIEAHWEKILHWARTCRGADIPRPNSRAAGLLLLLVGAAVARSLDRDEPLWHMVAESCSDVLRRAWFNSNDYPIDELRAAVREACNTLAIRNQLDLPQGKHRYWRTVQLQFGFSAKVSAGRLPYWLAGYSVPEAIKALLSNDDLNRSKNFQVLWSFLATWNRDQTNSDVESRVISNPWYPREAHGLIKKGLAASRESGILAAPRLEDEEPISSILGVPRFRAGKFQIGLASALPHEVLASPAPVLTLYVERMGIVRLVRDEHGGRTIENGQLSAPAVEVLDCPVREVSVSGRAGVLYRERFNFWPADSDVSVFRGNSGRLITNLDGFVAEAGCPYTIVTAGAVDLHAPGMPAPEHEVRSSDWKLYSFPQGLPDPLEARIEDLCLWSPQHEVAQPRPYGFALGVREKSVISLELTATAPQGWTIHRVRFAGQTFQGAYSIAHIPPVLDYLSRKAQIYASRDGLRQVIEVQPERKGPSACGATVENADGEWTILQRDALDAGVIEGSRMAVRWDGTADDPWLTLGPLPLVRDPQVLRRQRLKALGEPLELRFGLMNESLAERIPLAASVYSSGLLADVSETTDLYLLKLRHAIEAAPDLRVWVWEDESSEPRILSRSEVEAHSDNRTLSVLQMSVGAPLGWAVSLEGEWHGARFHVNPAAPEWSGLCYRWTSTLACSSDWPATASALRWWRFPVLMDPFKDIVQEQVKRHPLDTLLAWVGPATRPEREISRSDADCFSNPIRTFLWQYSPTAEACKAIWSVHGEAVLKSMETGKVALPAMLLLYSHPVLLAKVICEILSLHLAAEEAAVPIITNGNLFRRVPDPEKISAIESKYRSLFGITRDFVERSAGVFTPDRKMLDALLQTALSELRSWKDRSPLDEAYFRENAVKPAEALYDGQSCDATRLEIAVSRSRASCAYLVSHLLALKGLRGNS